MSKSLLLLPKINQILFAKVFLFPSLCLLVFCCVQFLRVCYPFFFQNFLMASLLVNNKEQLEMLKDYARRLLKKSLIRLQLFLQLQLRSVSTILRFLATWVNMIVTLTNVSSCVAVAGGIRVCNLSLSLENAFWRQRREEFW